jgi:glycerol uptake facilitator-like aquaporin
MTERLAVARSAVAEGLGTGALLAIVVGSGIMGERLSGGNAALTLLVNSLATGAGLFALIVTFSPISGAHLNPLVTLSQSLNQKVPWRRVVPIVLLQFAGAFVGVGTAHLMFGEPLFASSSHVRQGANQLFSEFVATFGLIAVILSCTRSRSRYTAFAVGAYIAAAYWFTSSTAFANPAVTLARAATATFSGIRLVDTPGFVLAQMAGAAVGVTAFRWLAPERSEVTSAVTEVSQRLS